MSICASYENTAGNKCGFLHAVNQRIILVPKYDATGTLNTLATIAGVTKTALQDKFKAALVANRYFPLGKMENVTFERGEADFQEFDSGNMEFVQDGKKSFVGFITMKNGAGPALLKRLNSFTDKEFGFFGIDTVGNFGYQLDSAGVIVKPVPIDGNSWRCRWIEPKYKEAGGIEVKFSVLDDFDDGDFRYIAKADLDFDGRNNGDVFALWDITITEVSNTLTELVVTVTTDYGVAVTGQTTVGFWYLYNTTDSAEITPSGVVESTTTPGQYTLTFSAQTPSDAYSLNLVSTQRYDPEDTLTGTLTA